MTFKQIIASKLFYALCSAALMFLAGITLLQTGVISQIIAGEIFIALGILVIYIGIPKNFLHKTRWGNTIIGISFFAFIGLLFASNAMHHMVPNLRPWVTIFVAILVSYIGSYIVYKSEKKVFQSLMLLLGFILLILVNYML